MNENLGSYYFANEADMFTFYKLPKELFTERFANMNPYAKILYGMLLDRLSLSKKNNWIDEYNRIFLIFSRAEAMKMLHATDKTITKIFRELIQYNLLEEVRQGQGKPNIIYMKKFYYTEFEPTKMEFKNRKKYGS